MFSQNSSVCLSISSSAFTPTRLSLFKIELSVRFVLSSVNTLIALGFDETTAPNEVASIQTNNQLNQNWSKTYVSDDLRAQRDAVSFGQMTIIM